jgi:uncharacterized protein YciI
MKAVVFYESAPDVAANAPAHASAHRARWDEFSRRGELLMIGPFANAQDDGAMAVFTTRAAAEEFVRGDPFVLNGVVSKWTILDWNEALIPESPGGLPGAGRGRPMAAEDFGFVKHSNRGQFRRVADLTDCSKTYSNRTGRRQSVVRFMSGLNGLNPVATLTFT